MFNADEMGKRRVKRARGKGPAKKSTKNKSDEFAQICGDRLRLAREALGISKADFARKLKFSDQRLATYEVGKRRLSPDVLQWILDHTGIDAGYLIHGRYEGLPRHIYEALRGGGGGATPGVDESKTPGKGGLSWKPGNGLVETDDDENAGD